MNAQEQIALLQTVVACLVKELCQTMEAVGFEPEARIKRVDIEDPPDIEDDDDPYTGDWIYRLKQKEG